MGAEGGPECAGHIREARSNTADERAAGVRGKHPRCGSFLRKARGDP